MLSAQIQHPPLPACCSILIPSVSGDPTQWAPVGSPAPLPPPPGGASSSAAAVQPASVAPARWTSEQSRGLAPPPCLPRTCLDWSPFHASTHASQLFVLRRNREFGTAVVSLADLWSQRQPADFLRIAHAQIKDTDPSAPFLFMVHVVMPRSDSPIQDVRRPPLWQPSISCPRRVTFLSDICLSTHDPVTEQRVCVKRKQKGPSSWEDFVAVVRRGL